MTEQTISPNVVKALAQFTAPKSHNRPTLTKLHIEDGTAVTADGFILATAPTQTNGFTGNLEPSQLLNVAKTVKRCDRLDLVTHTDEPRVVAMGTDTANWGPLTITNETYPDWRQIVPKAEDTDIQIQISPSLLDQLVKAAKAIDGNVVHLLIKQEPDGKAIRFAISGGTDPLSGVLMPMAGKPYSFE